MFYYFFEDYKEKIVKHSRRKLTRLEIFIFVSLFLSALLFFISFAVDLFVTSKYLNITKLISFCCTLVFCIILTIYSNYYFKHNRDTRRKKYINDHILPLMDLLKKYKLVSVDGVDWILAYCKEKRKTRNSFSLKQKSQLFITIVNSIIVFLLDIALKNTLKGYFKGILFEEAIEFIVLITIILFLIIWGITILRLFISFLLFPDKRVVGYLEDDIKYLKTQLDQKDNLLKLHTKKTEYSLAIQQRTTKQY